MKRFLGHGPVLLAAFALLLLPACHKKKTGYDFGPGPGTVPPNVVPPFSLVIRVIDEAGVPLPGATVLLNGTTSTTGADGTVPLPDLTGPIAVVASKAGYLDEPAILDRDEAGTSQDIRLWKSTSGSGARRYSLHLCGDLMLARRYITPVDDDTITVTPGDGGVSARAVVSAIAPLVKSATFTSANVECTIGTLPLSGVYPGKLFTIQSIPEITSLLDEIGLDLAVLANNHIRDWQEPGILSTTSILNAAGFVHCGAGVTDVEAAVPSTFVLNGVKVGVLCYCTLNGDTGNDGYARDPDPIPVPLLPTAAFQYEFRSWGYAGPTVTIPVASRRIGSAWDLIKAGEASAPTTAEQTDLWTSASAVYPELQDWVARRGHGGANDFSKAKVTADIAALRAAGEDLVIVQIHSGFNTYDDFEAGSTAKSTHEAIDAGADLVVGHHPHVLNGVEIYKGKLIVPSLGNFIFDQDFLATFTSAFLRVVYEETTPLEWKLVPITIHRYKPLPVAGHAARDVKRFLHERTMVDAPLQKLGAQVAAVLAPPAAGVTKPEISLDRHLIRLASGPGATSILPISLGAGEIMVLDDASLTRSRGPGATSLTGIQMGRDLFRWGHFEDDAADGVDQGGLHWRFFSNEIIEKHPIVLDDATSGIWALFMHRFQSNTVRTRIRPVARCQIRDHRLFTDGGGFAVPADGAASWSIHFNARKDNDSPTTVIIEVSHFDTSVPNEEPVSVVFRDVEIPFDIPADSTWYEVTVDIPPSTWDPMGGLAANEGMMFLALYPPSNRDTNFHADDVRFIEWRDPAALPDFDYNVDAIRSTGATSLTLERRDK